jgi:hypothetical protein
MMEPESVNKVGSPKYNGLPVTITLKVPPYCCVPAAEVGLGLGDAGVVVVGVGADEVGGTVVRAGVDAGAVVGAMVEAGLVVAAGVGVAGVLQAISVRLAIKRMAIKIPSFWFIKRPPFT